MDKLYSLYHQSPKNQNELRQVASSLEKQILQIGRNLFAGLRLVNEL